MKTTSSTCTSPGSILSHRSPETRKNPALTCHSKDRRWDGRAGWDRTSNPQLRRLMLKSSTLLPSFQQLRGDIPSGNILTQRVNCGTLRACAPFSTRSSVLPSFFFSLGYVTNGDYL